MLNHNCPKDHHFAVIGNDKLFEQECKTCSYAERDAQVFKKVQHECFGGSRKNITLLTNGTSVQMQEAINNTIKRAKNSEVPGIFYYAGHGWPTPDTQEPLLFPADIGPNQLESAPKPMKLWQFPY